MGKECKEQDRPGYVYLLKTPHGYKIGRSTSVEQRVRALRSILPFDVELVHTLRARDMVLCEQLWHEHFAEKKIKGEWFRLDEKDIAFFFCAGTYDSMQHLYCIEPTHNPSGYTEQDHLDRPEDIWEGDNDACLPN
jgi:hypothetical protein